MTYKKMPQISGGVTGCIHCGFQHETLPMNAVIGVGFGYAALEKNKDVIFCEYTSMAFDELMTVAEAEKLAAQEPDNDWRIHLVAPLSERHYQRQGTANWVLYEKGQGFA